MDRQGEAKLYRIGEAAAMLDLATCVLRFWEGEFEQLCPLRTPKGQRLYREEDMALLRRIRSLLHEQGMTIEGARRVLAGELRDPAHKNSREGESRLSATLSSPPQAGLLREAACELQSVRRLLSGSLSSTPLVPSHGESA